MAASMVSIHLSLPLPPTYVPLLHPWVGGAFLVRKSEGLTHFAPAGQTPRQGGREPLWQGGGGTPRQQGPQQSGQIPCRTRAYKGLEIPWAGPGGVDRRAGRGQARAMARPQQLRAAHGPPAVQRVKQRAPRIHYG